MTGGTQPTVIPDAIVRLVGELQIKLTLAQEALAELQPKPDDPDA